MFCDFSHVFLLMSAVYSGFGGHNFSDVGLILQCALCFSHGKQRAPSYNEALSSVPCGPCKKALFYLVKGEDGRTHESRSETANGDNSD